MTRTIQTSREQVVNWLRVRVASGEFTEGERLAERVLIDRLGVGRGPIRDALLELTKEGLLLAKPNCGVRIAPRPSDSTAALFAQSRRNIESHALQRGFDRIDDTIRDAWRSHLDRFSFVCQRENLADVVEEDMSFHRSIVQLDVEDHLEPVWLPIVSRMRLPYSRHHSLMESYEEHKRVVDAALSGDQEAAVAALRNNIQ